MDQILGVMSNDGVKKHTRLLFVKEHVLINPIQTISLRGGTVVRANANMHPRAGFLQPGQRSQRIGVVRISS